MQTWKRIWYLFGFGGDLAQKQGKMGKKRRNSAVIRTARSEREKR
jgi:hypothetical protein